MDYLHTALFFTVLALIAFAAGTIFLDYRLFWLALALWGVGFIIAWRML